MTEVILMNEIQFLKYVNSKLLKLKYSSQDDADIAALLLKDLQMRIVTLKNECEAKRDC